MKKLIIYTLLCIFLIGNVYADELIIDFTEKSIPVLNDELRKLRNAIRDAVGTVNNPSYYTIINEGIESGEVNAGVPSKIYDADEDTIVNTEESADEDIIRMDSAGTEIVTADIDQFAVNSEIKLGLEGNAGDTYFKYNETSDYLEMYVDGTMRAEF